jgi:hypothetical protein
MSVNSVKSLDKITKGFELIGTIEYELGKLLTELKDSKSYTVLGNHVHNWKDALKELGLTYSKAQTLIDVYETYPDLQTVKNYERLKDIAKLHKFGFIKDKDLEEITQKAMTLTIKDWTDEKNMLEGKTSYLTCEHKHADNYIRCLDCGRWLKV